jgi:hypothetical protein
LVIGLFADVMKSESIKEDWMKQQKQAPESHFNSKNDVNIVAAVPAQDVPKAAAPVAGNLSEDGAKHAEKNSLQQHQFKRKVRTKNQSQSDQQALHKDGDELQALKPDDALNKDPVETPK